MRTPSSARGRFSHALFVSALVLSSTSCFQGVNPNVDQIKCQSDNSCPTQYLCVKPSGESFGKCVLPGGKTDGGVATDLGSADTFTAPADTRRASDDLKTDALHAFEVAIAPDGKLPDALTPPATDAPMVSDSPGVPLGADAQGTPDAPVVMTDTAVPIDLRDAAQDMPLDMATDTAPPCNGGCCTNADCPLSTPICNSVNKCVACTMDQDCSGRSATACSVSSGACVQCTKNSQCGGATATCNTSTNTCVGCTQRSDCPGTCQTCSSGTCVAIKNADDVSKCTGTCDANGECKAKKGQKCSSVASGCLTGTTCAPEDICCDRACSGACEACDLTNATGTCTVLPTGSQPHAGHAACAGTGTCASTCTGAVNGSCTFPAGVCGTASCTANSSQATGTCSQGTCSMPSPVTCKPGASCSGTACACPAGTSDCGTACANFDSDAKNCGACGHDCLGGPCVGGYCRPYKLCDVATGRVGSLVPDGAKVYAITQQLSMGDTTKVWQMDASTPGTAVKIPPDMAQSTQCVIDGTMVWPSGADADGNITFGYCSVSGCAASTTAFTHVVQTGGYNNLDVYPKCDATNKEIVWAEKFTPTAGGDSTYNIIRSSVTGTNMRQMTSFSFENGATSAIMNAFPIGRSDRLIFTRTTGTTVELFSISTATKNATPVRLASGATGSPVDLGYGVTLANDSLLVWSGASSTYRVPVPNGIGSSAPPVFLNGIINSGIIDNYHFYGFLTNTAPSMQWCSLPTCTTSALSTSLSAADPYTFTQDAGSIFWSVTNAETNDGFSIWKVAKQAY